METVFLILLLLAAVVVANIVSWRFDNIPIAFIQIAAGLVLSFIPIYKHFELEPEVFLLVIISVLMFNDGQNTSLSRLTHQFGTTFSLSVELAIISILIVGFTTHLIIPSMPLALTFALGAIITPTDAVAVSSITSNMLVPKEVMGTLENESLFNDASGIVALNLAIAAAVTGQFSVMDGIGNFVYVFFGGILVGGILGAIIVAIRLRLINMHVDTPSVMVPFTLLTPFVVYLIAEAIGVSGILAVVVTGLIHGIQQNRLRLTSSRLQIVMNSTWQVVSSILNGIVFVLLGLSLPSVIINLHKHDTSSVFILLGVGILLYLIMTVLRYLWTNWDFARIRAWDRKEKHANSIVMAYSGVHGTITLAMAFSLPLTLNGQPFPYRTDIIFVATVVILTSLIVPTLALPLLLPKAVSKYSEEELAKAKGQMVDDAIVSIQTRHEKNTSTSQVINILDGQRTIEGHIDKAKLNIIFDNCFELEQQTILEMLKNEEITPLNANLYMRVARRTIIQYQQSAWQRFILVVRFGILEKFSPSKEARRRRKIFHQMKHQQADNRADMIAKNKKMWRQMAVTEKKPFEKVTSYLNQSLVNDKEKSREINLVRRAYDERHRRLTRTFNENENFENDQNELLIEAFQQENTYIQSKVATKEFSTELGSALYEQISTDQLVYLQSLNEE
ncbi:Na+/H+ antiporter [Companilactobacillus nantensis]|uniref:NhaP2 protein n=1 Tax=Companilactobacillus nantensis DSM 16982 TaxID=1423774 RepID=A0A0R1WFD5_9LACO|nr:Na+/H+ antiporter [Companilactobacillus nantensis]KRM14347.1 nhaP2 protein [Companilactobacillus nantensis DSM 16982]GEO65335.1 Na+/H+ antiporter [Companilactobacillus nantensis]